MPKQASGPTIVAIDAAGKATRVKAERLEIDFGEQRKLVLAFPEHAWGVLEIEADAGSDDAMPVISVQPAACNVLTLRVDVHYEMLPAEPIGLPEAVTPPALTLAVQKALDSADKANAPKKHQIRRWAQAALRRDAEVTVRLVSEAEGRELNREYRGKDYATNVLTFTYGEGGDIPAVATADVHGGPLVGDLVLCVPVVVREAAEQGKTVEAHFAHLIVHGMLHLQGHDHEMEADAERMEALERQIMAGLGHADPYA